MTRHGGTTLAGDNHKDKSKHKLPKGLQFLVPFGHQIGRTYSDLHRGWRESLQGKRNRNRFGRNAKSLIRNRF